MQFVKQSFLFVRRLTDNRLKTFYFYSTVSLTGAKSNTIKSNNMGDKSNLVLKRVENIIKSQEDKRLYRGLELSNHMKVLLVSDSTTDKSAAALDVNVGFMSDPREVLGLAHFCEHMLFLGTEKYPNENDYSKFLSEHGGSSNAATYPDHTIYYFDVVPDELNNALDRFSQFFIAPLFTESATDREVNAVNSEHEKNIPIDVWRKDQLDKHMADPNHPYHTFGTGNKYTLDTLPKERNINVRDELLKFHAKWYSSNIMCLAVLGKESLDELENMVVNLFSEVKDKSVVAPRWEEHPFKEEHFGTSVHMCPIKDVRNLNIVFPCPDLQEYYKSSPSHYISHLMGHEGPGSILSTLKAQGFQYISHFTVNTLVFIAKFYFMQFKLDFEPSHYISHLMGHEGPGSILSTLKARGWSNNLVAGSRPAPRGMGFFGVTVDLTEEGINHTDDIVELIFQYINMLKTQGPQKWVQDENRDIGSMLFRFKDKESPRTYISGLVHTLQDYAMEDVLSCMYLLSEWKPELIEQIWSDFVPEKIRIVILAKQYENELDQVEPWYGTKFKVSKIPKKTLEQWREAGISDSLKMPEKNEFIPTDFQLYPIDKDVTEHPTIIQDTALTRIWFKQDETFLLPKANVMFDFVSPLAYLDPLNCNLTHMLVQLFRDALNEYAYAAELAGLKWELINTKYGLILAIGGYSNKQHIFLDKVMEKLTNFKIDPKRFEICKENYIRNLKNFAAEQPYQHAVYYLAVLLTEHSWTKQELLAATEQLTIDKLEAFIPQILSRMHIECLIHGNANREKALQLVQIVEDRLLSTLNMSPLLPRQLLLNRELKLEDGCNYLYEVQNNVHKESCIELYYQCGLQSKENNMKLELFAQIIQEPCFDILRTKEQLGYIVFSGIRRSNGVQGLRIIVQSDRHPTYLDERIEEFLKNMLVSCRFIDGSNEPVKFDPSCATAPHPLITSQGYQHRDRVLRLYIGNMSEEEFLRHREALAAQRLEKPKQLSTQTNLYWGEITAQQYHFDRANIEVAYLRTLTKDDIIDFHKKLLEECAQFRKKLSVHVVSMAEGGAGKVAEKEYTATVKGPTPSIVCDITVFKSSHEMHPLVQPYINITRKGNKCKL